MEKARYTLFQPRSWIFLTLMCVCFSSLTIHAQEVIEMPSDSTSIVDTLDVCNDAVSTGSPVSFTDDGSTDGLYADENVRTDTTTFCPTDQWHRVKVVFTEFDLSPGDTLFAFQGDLAAYAAAGIAALNNAVQDSVANTQGAVDNLLADSMNNTTITIPTDVTADGLQGIVDGGADSSAVAAAIDAGFFDEDLDLADSTTLAEAIEALEILQLVALNLLEGIELSPGSLSGTVGASEGTGTGVGVGATNLATARGGSVSDAFGGWIDANCNPAVNPSGCLTFVFETNGDRAKGSGWEAWVDCEERNIEFEDATIPADVYFTCTSSSYDTLLTIVAPNVVACSDELSRLDANANTIIDTTQSIIAEIKNANGEVVKRQIVKPAAASVGDSITGRYGVGCYTVTFKLLSDTLKTSEIQSFCVNPPFLACNDEISTVFGSACQLSVTPDMILEGNPCDTSAFLSYTINFRFDDEVIATGTLADLPSISHDSLVSAGAPACNGEIEVEIIRTITTPDTTSTGVAICSNGSAVSNCTTTLKYRDNTAPVFVNHTPSLDTLIQADTAGITALIDQPAATDNCGTANVTSTIASVLNDAGDAAADPSDICAYPIKVVINHVATDECDNASNTLTDTVVIIRPFAFTVPGIDSLECNAADPGYLASGAPRLQVGRIQNGDTTYVDSLALVVDTLSYTAGYILRYTDQVINDNDCGSKIFRAYSYVDWCDNSPGVQAIGTQFIHYFDQSAPEFTYVGADTIESGATRINLDFGACTQVINPTAPSAVDGCDTNPTVAMFSVMQRLNDSVYTRIGANLAETGALACDTFRIRWRVFDACHTQTVEDTIDTYYIIQDVEDPVVTCEDEVYVSVSNSAGVVMDAATFYKTATDNCGTPSVLVRREGEDDSAWRQSILVQCNALVQDVNHNSFNVEVQVTDKNGRTNSCWVRVTPEDKIAPICNDIPDDTTRLCNEFHNGELGTSTDTNGNGVMDATEWVVLDKNDAELDALRNLLNTEFGIPSCTDNLDECGAIEITQSYQLIEDGCGVIRLKRKWSATDWGAQGGVNTSQEQEQSITINYQQDWTLTFPADATLTCGEDGIPAPASFDDIVTSGACDNFLLNVTEETFATPGETCMKLIRTYELINWCVYDVDMPGYVIPHNVNGFAIADDTIANNQGKFTYTQVIKLDVSEGGIIVEQNSAEIDTCIVGIGDALPFGEEDQNLTDDVFECNSERTFTASATNCLGISLSKFSHRVTEDGVEVANADGATVTVNVEPGKTYAVTFVAFDDCNNSNSSTETYTFRDCKRPTPYVLNGIAIELGEGGTVDIWASDLDEGSYDNCTDQADLEMYISKERVDDASADNATNLAAIRATGSSLTLGCDDVGTRVVYIYVVDASGNWDVVETFVLVESNIFDCVGANEGGMVAGHIVNSNGENVEQVSVSISGGMQESTTTGTDGAFQFNVTTGANYTVTPVKDMNPLNGVSTFDLVLISKHILGITAFDSPYKHIAADVNKSGTITAFDMVQLRKLILNVNTEFSNNDSWRFVDADHDFSSTTVTPAAQDFAEFKNISELATNMMNLDFVGVKIGDVNGNAAANSLLGAESRTTNGTLDFNVTDRLVEAGETVTVDFSSADIATAQGYQFTMNFAGLNLTKLEEGVAKADNFNTNLVERGVLTTSWNGQATANDVLFSLTFNATSAGLLSELITLSSDITTAEAYNTDGELLDVNIEFTTVDVDFALAQNVPNPFNGETVVGFKLPAAGTATLKVMDVQGKVLKEIRGDYAKGYNQVTLNAKELTTGVLYYQLESADKVATKKMIIID